VREHRAFFAYLSGLAAQFVSAAWLFGGLAEVLQTQCKPAVPILLLRLQQ
jgi:hypothetical protein